MGPLPTYVSSSSSSSIPHVPASESGWSDQVESSRTAPVRHHWFYLRAQEKYWIPFSQLDSGLLESALLTQQDTSQQVLTTTQGRREERLT